MYVFEVTVWAALISGQCCSPLFSGKTARARALRTADYPIRRKARRMGPDSHRSPRQLRPEL